MGCPVTGSENLPNFGPFMQPVTSSVTDKSTRPSHPFRRALLRGLGIVLPPLLTVVVFIWAWTLIAQYVLHPVEGVASWTLIRLEWDVRRTPPDEADIENYQLLSTREWIPRHVYERVTENPGTERPVTANQYYRRYVRIQYLQPWIVIPTFLLFFISLLYLLGWLLAAGVGRLMWASFERLIDRLPLIRNVYSSVKQVTDFVFSEQTIEFNRVVAVEYPRKGIWSIGFVTGESLLDIRSAVNEPVVSLLMPTSPLPMTGFTITMRKSETIDLDMTIDQAIQFMVSCGVVIPPLQLQSSEPSSRLSAELFSVAQLPDATTSADDSSASSTEDSDKSSSPTVSNHKPSKS
jgi:uncharacterized membrane protein